MNRSLAFTALALTVGGLVTFGAISSDNTPAARAADAATGSTYFPQTPVRLFDTRASLTTLGPLGVKTVALAGVDGIPVDATAVIMNVTAVNGTTDGYLTVYPDGVARPATTNLNWVAGQAPTPNLVTVPIGRDGRIDVFNYHGNVDVLADLEGYFAGGNVGPPTTTPTTTKTTTPTTTTTTTTPPTTTTTTTTPPVSPPGG